MNRFIFLIKIFKKLNYRILYRINIINNGIKINETIYTEYFYDTIWNS